jgi:hypothetical protein
VRDPHRLFVYGDLRNSLEGYAMGMDKDIATDLNVFFVHTPK